MKQIYPDLWQSAPEQPFPDSFPEVTTRAYLLRLTSGENVLFYSTGLDGELAPMEALGGITRQYLSHRDEAGPALAQIRERFGSRLYCHALEVEAVSRYCTADEVIRGHEVEPGGIEIIHTPGHTPGSLCFLYASPHGMTYLFTGDTLLIGADGRWDNGYLPFSDRDTLIASLEMLRTIRPDVVLPSATEGNFPYRELAAGSWHAALDDALAPLR